MTFLWKSFLSKFSLNQSVHIKQLFLIFGSCYFVRLFAFKVGVLFRVPRFVKVCDRRAWGETLVEIANVYFIGEHNTIIYGVEKIL